MTQRERQILRWIEENPMISQQELAEKAGITRSSVAVHISNLMKKGHIAGKGYIVHTAPYAVVVGGVNMDIGGQPYGELVVADSNPGRVRMSLGGVGRNIAHNMSLLGMDTRMLTVFGDDLYAQRIAASCGELGIDISQCLTVPGGSTSTYLFVADRRGDMSVAVSDMEIYAHMTPSFLASRSGLLNSAQLIVVDTNIPAETIAWLTDHVKLPIFSDPVSTAKAEKLRPVLGKLHTLKPNQLEAELLSGVEIRDEDSPNRAADALLAICLLSSLIIPSAAEAAPEPEPLPSWCYGMLADGYAVGLFGDEIADTHGQQVTQEQVDAMAQVVADKLALLQVTPRTEEAERCV